MGIRPLYDRLVVRRLAAETMTDSGIVIPHAVVENPNQGEVIATGAGTVLESGQIRPLTLTPGDRVIFGKYAGTVIKVDGEELLVMKESDIFAIIDPEKVREKAA